MNKLSFYSLAMSFIALMLFWIIMSGFFTVFHLVLGAVSVVGIMVINYKLKTHRFYDDDMDDLKQLRFFRAIYYFLWMAVQITKAGFHVAYIILRPKMPIETAMLKFKVDLPSAHARMILGNSIILTPGTLTLDIEGDYFTVHALDKYSYEGIVSDKMPKEVLKLFEKEERPVISDVNITTSNA